jgi:hypothetical protein
MCAQAGTINLVLICTSLVDYNFALPKCGIYNRKSVQQEHRLYNFYTEFLAVF